MARKGSSKVRTGCLTCKIRKIKCDEGKPHCQRCVTTGRKCDGYTPATATSSLSWHRPRHLFPSVDNVGERRALQYFCQIAGPSLPGAMDPYFWTNLVIQFGSFEPAVRHSIVAISSLYEELNSNPKATQLQAGNGFALHHYNRAIRELKAMENEPLVLLVCVLFVCIEFLLGNRESAIEHCKHGIFILETVEDSYAWTKEYLSPIFRRLSVFPFFFGTNSTHFPKLLGLDNKIPASFQSLEKAQYYVDGIVTRTVRLVRQGDTYRFGAQQHNPISPELLSEQHDIRAMLDDWHVSFSGLEVGQCISKKRDASLCNIVMRYEVARVWVETPFAYHETAYDMFIPKFRWMVDRAAKLCSSMTSETDDSQVASSFIFEMGFTPLLYFITMKCRCLPTRVQALSLMKKLGVSRENLWNVSTMYAAGRRIVEIEHGVLLDESGQPSGPVAWPGLPPDEMRVRDSTTDPRSTKRVDLYGRVFFERAAGFYRRNLEGDIYLQPEYLIEMT